MSKKSKTSLEAMEKRIEEIKKLGLIAMVSDDLLMENLVLKGGNALDLILQVGTRASIDLDFSVSEAFPGGIDALRERIEKSIIRTFREAGYEAFDIKVAVQPPHLTSDIAGFWGGYSVEFKLIEAEKFEEFSSDIDGLRRNALQIGRGQKFLIDISCHEYTADKKSHMINGYQIFVYSPEMMLCEKLRAICQQMPEYASIVKRERAGGPRARDFLDIHTLVIKYHLNLDSSELREMLVRIFQIKRVPIKFLGLIKNYHDFHGSDFDAVAATTKPGIKLEKFDFYFNFVLDLVKTLETLWNE